MAEFEKCCDGGPEEIAIHLAHRTIAGDVYFVICNKCYRIAAFTAFGRFQEDITRGAIKAWALQSRITQLEHNAACDKHALEVLEADRIRLEQTNATHKEHITMVEKHRQAALDKLGKIDRLSKCETYTQLSREQMLEFIAWQQVSNTRAYKEIRRLKHDKTLLVEALEESGKTLDYYTPFLQDIPGVQSPDCTKLFQAKIDIIRLLSQV